MEPRVLSEDELDREFGTKAKLESGGNYGCKCLVFDGDFEIGDAIALEDTFFYRWNDRFGDVGTIVFTGSVRCAGEACVSDRLMCLVVLGDFVADTLSVFETEVLVAGDLKVRELKDRDEYLKVMGRREVG